MIDVSDVARSVLHMANQPLHVNVYHLMVMATKMPTPAAAEERQERLQWK